MRKEHSIYLDGSPWSDEDKRLLKYLKENGVSSKVIAYLLKRSISSVETKSYRLGLKKKFVTVVDENLLEIKKRSEGIDNITIGKFNEEYVKIKLAEQGFDLYEPVIDGHRTDLFILYRDNPIRIQVKTATYDEKYNIFRTQLKSSTKNSRIYEEKDVDFFIVKLNNLDIYYVIPFKVSLKTTVFNFSPFREKISHNNIDYEPYRDAFDLLHTYISALANN